MPSLLVFQVSSYRPLWLAFRLFDRLNILQNMQTRPTTETYKKGQNNGLVIMIMNRLGVSLDNHSFRFAKCCSYRPLCLFFSPFNRPNNSPNYKNLEKVLDACFSISKVINMLRRLEVLLDIPLFKLSQVFYHLFVLCHLFSNFFRLFVFTLFFPLTLY